MKRSKLLTIFGFVFLGLFLMTGCLRTEPEANQHNDYLRIHIRANSNSKEDQDVKYLVRDAVVDYLIPLAAKASSKEDMVNIIRSNMGNIETVADNVLEDNDKNYTSSGKVCNEYFPTRVYDGVVFESNYYDALILELGTGTGDNWWCVVYPPLCFANSKEINTTHIRYKSKIVELVKEFFGR